MSIKSRFANPGSIQGNHVIVDVLHIFGMSPGGM